MAKKRKRKTKAKHFRVGRFAVPETMIAAAVTAASSPLGRQIISDALVHAAGVLIRRYPGAAAASAGAEAADAAKSFGHSASEAVANFLHAAADRIRSYSGTGEPMTRGGADTKSDPAARRPGNGADDLRERLDENTIRRALMGELQRKKAKKKKAKLARGH